MLRINENEMKAYKRMFVASMVLMMCLFMAGCCKSGLKPDSAGKATQQTIGTPGLIVRGITYSENSRYAVIGTKTMQEGDEINGAIIAIINPDNVVFEKDGKRWTQEVAGEEK